MSAGDNIRFGCRWNVILDHQVDPRCEYIASGQVDLWRHAQEAHSAPGHTMKWKEGNNYAWWVCEHCGNEMMTRGGAVAHSKRHPPTKDTMPDQKCVVFLPSESDRGKRSSNRCNTFFDTKEEKIEHINQTHCLGRGFHVRTITGYTSYEYVCDLCNEYKHGNDFWDAVKHVRENHPHPLSTNDTNGASLNTVMQDKLKRFLGDRVGWTLADFQRREPELYEQIIGCGAVPSTPKFTVKKDDAISALSLSRDKVDAYWTEAIADLEKQKGLNEDRADALNQYYAQVTAALANGDMTVGKNGEFVVPEGSDFVIPMMPMFTSVDALKNKIVDNERARDKRLDEIDLKLSLFKAVVGDELELTEAEWNALTFER